MENYGIQVGDMVEWRDPTQIGSMYRGEVLAFHGQTAWVVGEFAQFDSVWTGLLNKVEE